MTRMPFKIVAATAFALLLIATCRNEQDDPPVETPVEPEVISPVSEPSAQPAVVEQPAPEPKPAEQVEQRQDEPAARVAAQPSYMLVPVYGPLGRFRGYQRVQSGYQQQTYQPRRFGRWRR